MGIEVVIEHEQSRDDGYSSGKSDDLMKNLEFDLKVRVEVRQMSRVDEAGMHWNETYR